MFLYFSVLGNAATVAIVMCFRPIRNRWTTIVTMTMRVASNGGFIGAKARTNPGTGLDSDLRLTHLYLSLRFQVVYISLWIVFWAYLVYSNCVVRRRKKNDVNYQFSFYQAIRMKDFPENCFFMIRLLAISDLYNDFLFGKMHIRKTVIFLNFCYVQFVPILPSNLHIPPSD